MWRCAGLVLAAMLPAANATAQLEGMLGKGSGDLKGLAGMASAPMASGSMGNVAGLLQYCIGNNYLSGAGATSVQDKLMNKLPGGARTEDRGYSDGQKGLLHGANGNLLDLGGGEGGEGGGLTSDLKKKACDTILSQARSFL
nr:DUF2501 domain-containing protein [uncultured Massilia sp.]